MKVLFLINIFWFPLHFFQNDYSYLLPLFHSITLYLCAQDALSFQIANKVLGTYLYLSRSSPTSFIFHLFDESGPRKPYDFRKHREMYKPLMALRLTCKELESIASRQLFRTFCLSPSLESWAKLQYDCK